jgi:protein-tyrosine phosphatase
VIDLHSHILPGLDDGSATLEDAVEMARSAVADGIRVIAATPHVRSDYPTEPAEMEEAVQSVRTALREHSIPLELLTGGEIDLAMLSRLSDPDLRRFGLGGNPRYLLIESPYTGWPLGLEQTVFELQLRGFAIVLAHPERNEEVQERPERLERVVEMGVLIQLTAASIDGRLGPRSQKTGLRLLERDLAHLLASDAHAPSVRQVGMAASASVIGDDALARWLTRDVPGAIVGDSQVPPRPERAGGRLRRRLRR